MVSCRLGCPSRGSRRSENRTVCQCCGKEEIKKLNALIHRYKHVKPDFDTSMGECKPEEIRMWAARRQRLVEHYNLLGSKDVQWLATAASSRVRPLLGLFFFLLFLGTRNKLLGLSLLVAASKKFVSWWWGEYRRFFL